jgi:hypothetical protein
METALGCTVMLLIGFVVWSAVTRRGIRHVLGWSAVGLLAAIVATTVVMTLLPPLPEIQEQLGMPPGQRQVPSPFLVSFLQYNGHMVIWLAFSAFGAIRQLQKGASKVSAEAGRGEADPS